MVANAALGGGVAVLGGGKFENGAITGAFGYLFNACGTDPAGCAKIGLGVGLLGGTAASAACDAATTGICVFANPEIIAASAAAGSAAGAAMDHAADLIQGVIDRATAGRDQYQYVLTAQSAGFYPDVRNGQVWLDTGDVWKYGTSVDPDGRYTQAQMKGLDMTIQYYGGYTQVLIQEKMQLLGYATTYGQLPPGNKIWR